MTIFIQSYINSNLLYVSTQISIGSTRNLKYANRTLKKGGGEGVIPRHERLWAYFVCVSNKMHYVSVKY